MPVETSGYAAMKAGGRLEEFKYTVRDVGPHDVHISVKFCGVCHSDIHQVRDEWFPGSYPMVAGHEVLGIVTRIGSGVTRFKIGDRGAVGCFVDSCRECRCCEKGEEQFCKNAIWTYNSKIKETGAPTYGGYGRDIVVDENYVIKISSEWTEKEFESVAPLLCAGVTVYAPMRLYKADRPGCRIGVLGLGGLGHMVVKLGVAFGNPVTVISHTETKRDQAIKELKATRFINSSDAEDMKNAEGSLDILINTITVNDGLDNYMNLLDVGGRMVLVALPPHADLIQLSPFPLVFKERSICGSAYGGLKIIQETLDFCTKHKILPMCELITADQINIAFERCISSDVRYRFVIDHTNTKYQYV